MKTKSILAALLLMACGVQTTWAQLVVLHKTNGQTIECNSWFVIFRGEKSIMKLVLGVRGILGVGAAATGA